MTLSALTSGSNASSELKCNASTGYFAAQQLKYAQISPQLILRINELKVISEATVWPW